MNKLLCFIKENIHIYRSLVLNDFCTRYNGSAFGVFWGIINPIITILIYWFVFTVGLRTGMREDGTPYILWLICGMLPWFFIAEAILTMSNSFVEYGYLVKKLNFSLVLIPLIKLGSAILMHLVFFTIAFMIFNISGYTIRFYNIQVLYYASATIFFLFGSGLLFSSIVVFFRDMAQILNILVQLGFWAIPIVWGSELLSDNLKIIFKLNPLYYLVEGYRESLLVYIPFWNHPYETVYFWFFSIFLTYFGVKFFLKLKPYFSDVL